MELFPALLGPAITVIGLSGISPVSRKALKLCSRNVLITSRYSCDFLEQIVGLSVVQGRGLGRW